MATRSKKSNSGLTLTVTGSFKNTERYLSRAANIERVIRPLLDTAGKNGVSALKAATPVDTGITAKSWFYEIEKTPYGFRLSWYNTNDVNGVPIVIFVLYGHATKSGRWVRPNDFVTPALKPIIQDLNAAIEREVDNL